MVNGDIVKETLVRFPNTPTLTLAKKIYKENSQCFTNVESVRSLVRKYRGQMGKFQREITKDQSNYRESFDVNVFDGFPEEIRSFDDWSTYPIEDKRWLVLCDLHIPYYDRKSLEIALRYGHDEQVTGIVLLGDIADFYWGSRWEKDPRKRDMAKERDALLQFLETLRKIFPKIQIIYKLGNHEERLERYLRIKAPELLNLELLSFESIIEADRFEIDVVDDRRLMKCGHLYMIHGHEFGQRIYNPVNPARGLFLRGNEIAICGHFHQTSQHTSKTMGDNIISCWSVGCMSELHPEYIPINNWNHGFAIIDSTKGEFVVHNKKVIKGRIY